MQLINQKGEKLELRVIAYHYEYSFGKLFDSDHLKALLLIDLHDEKLNTPLDFLLVEELERIEKWLRSIQEQVYFIHHLDFIDPNFNVYVKDHGNTKKMQMVFTGNYVRDVVWECEVNEEFLNNCIEQLRLIQRNFPCRCQQPHDFY